MSGCRATPENDRARDQFDSRSSPYVDFVEDRLMVLGFHLAAERLHEVPLQLGQDLHVILLRVQQLLDYEIAFLRRRLDLKTDDRDDHNKCNAVRNGEKKVKSDWCKAT